ncbi:hypothetical protein ALC53_05748 [Atta colombica]|uniref:Uncharacterized protein n=1 Tax=Atta colombica TaxID=520822 RepID=A0A195BGV2_9HYME|nr:hypothetical protein ALC53_05748 [Atta colombica]
MSHGRGSQKLDSRPDPVLCDYNIRKKIHSLTSVKFHLSFLRTRSRFVHPSRPPARDRDNSTGARVANYSSNRRSTNLRRDWFSSATPCRKKGREGEVKEIPENVKWEVEDARVINVERKRRKGRKRA